MIKNMTILVGWIVLTLVGSTVSLVAQKSSEAGAGTNRRSGGVSQPKPPTAAPIFEAEKGVAQGILAEERGRTEEAIETYQRTIEQFDRQRPHVAQAIFRLAEAYREQGKTDDAKVLYARLLREFPDQFDLARIAHRRLFPERASKPGPKSVDSSPRSERRPGMSSESDQLNLRLMSVDREAQIPDQGRRLIIVAKIGDNLHVRGFDEDGNREFDIAEGELAPDKRNELKQVLEPYWANPDLLKEHEQALIRRAESILRDALLSGDRRKARVIKNLNGLKQIQLGIRIHASNHGGALPKRLKAIDSKLGKTRLPEICRRINENGRLIYFPHPRKMSEIESPADTALLVARLDLDPAVVLVGYANGHVSKVDQGFLQVLRSALDPYAAKKSQQRATMILASRLLVDSDRKGLSDEARSLTEMLRRVAREIKVKNEADPYAAVTIHLKNLDEESTPERPDPTEIPRTLLPETPEDALKHLAKGIQTYAANAEGRLPPNLGKITEYLGDRKRFEKVIQLFSSPGSKKSGGVVYIRPTNTMSGIPDKAEIAVLVGIPPSSDAAHVAYADGHVTTHNVSNSNDSMAGITTILTDELKKIKELYTEPVVRLGLQKSMPFQSVVALHEMFSQLGISAKLWNTGFDSGEGIMLLSFEEGTD